MEVSVHEYMSQVSVVATPTTSVPHEKGGLGEGTEFWVHTVGMGQFGRPEIEMVKVPALWLKEAAGRVNHWAYYTITQSEIRPGENIKEGNTPFDAVIMAIESPDENRFWEARNVPCIRLQLGAVTGHCAACGEEPSEECRH